MNILTEKLPESVMLGGKHYKINADFKTAVKIITYAEENNGIKLLIYALKTFYVQLPESIELAIEGMNSFYKGTSRKKGTGEEIFSLSKDADLIFSSFMSQYKINLAEDNFHWYIFLALLKGLCGDNIFSKVVGIRSLDISKIKDAEKRAYFSELKQKYSLSGGLTIDEGLRRVF